MTNPPADISVREQALDPSQSFIVDAPAGSGKTTLLTQRFLRLLSITRQPESIVAITFTRKAAEEMRSRILDALRLASEDPETLDPATRRWAIAALATSHNENWRLLENPRRLRIQTIDSLCATLARRGPLLSGYTGGAEVRENATQLYQQAARATIGVLAERGVWSDAVRVLLRHLDNDWQRLEDLLSEMLARRDQWLRVVVRDPDRLLFESALEIAVIDELSGVERLLPDHLHADLVSLCQFVGTNLQREAPQDPLCILAYLPSVPGHACDELCIWQAIGRLFLTNNGSVRKRVTKSQGLPPKGEDARDYKALFFDLAERFEAIPGLVEALDKVRRTPSPNYSDAQWGSIEALFRVLKLTAAELKIAFRRNRIVDFSEVSHAALAALGDSQDPSELGLLLDYQIQHLLIDEFQDTSITQYELIERLIDGWTDGDGRTLFLVGDPMQSIYRFRQAEVGLFIETRNAARLASVALKVLQLTTNFRTQAALIDWINSTIAAMRDEPACPFDRMPHLVAAREATNLNPARVHGFIAQDSSAEADAVVAIVKQHQTEKPSASIGILVRGRRHLGSISNALSAAGIAVNATEIERLGDQIIVQDLLALTRALLHRGDRTAWLGVLRAPWCGLSLHALATLFEGDRHRTIWQQINDESCVAALGGQEQKLLANFKNNIGPSLEAVGRVALAPLVEYAWLALGGPAAYREVEHTHAHRYLEILQTCERRETFVTATRLEEILDRQYVAPAAKSGSSITIMTIHRAKGLEFDVVIIPGLGRMARAEQHSLLAWRAHNSATGRRLLFAPIPRIGGGDDPIHAFLHEAEKKDLADESYRLLYVALTRARETLHLIGTLKEARNDDPPSPPARSFLSMLWSALDEGSMFVATDSPTKPITSISSELEQTVTRPVLEGALIARDPIIEALENDLPSAIEFEWASPIAKHIGTVTHTILQLICREGRATVDTDRVRELSPFIDGRLRALGVSQQELADARERIIEASVGAVSSERGRWILDAGHAMAESEYSLTAVANGRSSTIVIDRTFIDAKGDRWIVDFKTGSHSGGSVDAFLDSEVERYRGQLERYARFMAAREDNPIMLGLFFPLLGQWREWRFDPNKN